MGPLNEFHLYFIFMKLQNNLENNMKTIYNHFESIFYPKKIQYEHKSMSNKIVLRFIEYRAHQVLTQALLMDYVQWLLFSFQHDVIVLGHNFDEFHSFQRYQLVQIYLLYYL